MNVKQTKIGKYKYWTVDLRGQGRGRLFDRDKDALIERLRREIAGIGDVQFDDSDRVAKMELGGRGTLLEAVRYFLASQVGVKKKRLADAVEECLADKKQIGLRPAYTSHMRSILRQFAKFTGDVECSSVSMSHVKDFLFGRKCTHETRSGMRNRLSAFFSWCCDHGYTLTNPVRKVSLGRASRVVPKIFTPEEVHRLLDTVRALDPALLPYFALGIFCGIRPDELKRLPQTCVRAADGIVDIPGTVSKTHDRRIVDLSPNAIAWLRSVNGGLRYARKRRIAIIKAARVDWSHDVMRHTFASYHLQFHGSADKTAAQMGHHGNTKTLYRHYRATVDAESAAAFWRIEPAVDWTYWDANEHVKAYNKAQR
jgi:integrase